MIREEELPYVSSLGYCRRAIRNGQRSKENAQ